MIVSYLFPNQYGFFAHTKKGQDLTSRNWDDKIASKLLNFNLFSLRNYK